MKLLFVLGVSLIGMIDTPQQLRRLDGRVPVLLLIDSRGDGLCLTSPSQGVDIRFGSNGIRQRVAWTCPKTDDGFLALDVNRNGRIEVPAELLGAGIGPEDAWEYLSRFDGKRRLEESAKQPDGFIDTQDGIYDALVIWTDNNRDVQAQETELTSLRYAGIDRIQLAPAEPTPKSIADSVIIRIVRTTGTSSSILYSVSLAVQ